jgi:basic amino acid/polyamine antiporter, APA family
VPIAACVSLAWVFYETVERKQFFALVLVLAVIFILYGLRAWRLQSTAR